MAIAQPTADRDFARRSTSLLGGGTDGNEQLTAMTGVLLLVLLAVLGVTIVFIGQLLWLHLFIGLLVIGPVALKLGSTGYRMVSYYARNAAYRIKGPPPAWLRALGPVVIVSSLAVIVTGVMLLAEGPSSRGSLLFWHKATFFVWLAVTSLHVLGHLLELPGSLRAVRRKRPDLPGLEPGGLGRSLSLLGAVVGGAVLALLFLPDFHAWTSAHFHHHHLGG